MTQTWHDLLFAHWAVDVRALRSRVPAPFELDLFDGQAWIGIVPFRMTNVAPRGIPPWRFLSEFPELNVRTYVKVADRPGVYFFSLDAGSSLAVRGARTLLNLPYHLAAMTVTARENAIDYDSRRSGEGPAAVFVATYEPLGAEFIPAERSLEFFLTERYCLYNLDRRGRPYRLEIHHPPWELQSARLQIARNTMAEVHGLVLPNHPPLVHFVTRQDMVAWPPTVLG